MRFQSLFYWITYSYSSNSFLFIFFPPRFQSLFYWITYSYPFCRENLLFIIITEFFSDIKIIFFSIFLVIFCLFFTIFRNSKYLFLLVLRGFFSTFLFPVVVEIFLQTYFTILFWFFKVFLKKIYNCKCCFQKTYRFNLLILKSRL